MFDQDTKSLEFLMEAVEGNIATVYHGDDMAPRDFIEAIAGREYKNSSKLYKDGLYCVRNPLHAERNNYGDFIYKILVRNMKDFFHFDPTTFKTVYPDKASYTEIEAEAMQDTIPQDKIAAACEAIRKEYGGITDPPELARTIRRCNSVIEISKIMRMFISKTENEILKAHPELSKDDDSVMDYWPEEDYCERLSKKYPDLADVFEESMEIGNDEDMRDMLGTVVNRQFARYPKWKEKKGKTYTDYAVDSNEGSIDDSVYTGDYRAAIPFRAKPTGNSRFGRDEYMWSGVPKYLSWQLKQWIKKGLRTYDGRSVVDVLKSIASSRMSVSKNKTGFNWMNSSIIAHAFVVETNLAQLCSGITYSGGQDGRCLLIYDWNNIYVTAWAEHPKGVGRDKTRTKTLADERGVYNPIDYGSEDFSEYAYLKRRPPIKYADNGNAENEDVNWARRGDERRFNRRYFDSLPPEKQAIYGLYNSMVRCLSDGKTSQTMNVNPMAFVRSVYKRFDGLDNEKLVDIACGDFGFNRSRNSYPLNSFPNSSRVIDRGFEITKQMLSDWTPEYVTHDEEDSESPKVERKFVYGHDLYFGLRRALSKMENVLEGIGERAYDYGLTELCNACAIVVAADLLLRRAKQGAFKVVHGGLDAYKSHLMGKITAGKEKIAGRTKLTDKWLVGPVLDIAERVVDELFS